MLWHRDAELRQYFEAAKMQNLLIDERKQELKDEGKTDPVEQAIDPDLQRLEEVCRTACRLKHDLTLRPTA